jgi:Thiopurine S-methyltransferase (TPMT)
MVYRLPRRADRVGETKVAGTRPVRHISRDNVIDSGLFHVFTDEDRVKYIRGLNAVLKPGGRLFLLCFSDATPGTMGPRRVTKKELQERFAEGWLIESIEPARIEVRPGPRRLRILPRAGRVLGASKAHANCSTPSDRSTPDTSRLVGSDLRAWRRLWTDDGQPLHNPLRQGLPTIRERSSLGNWNENARATISLESAFYGH